MRAFWFSFLGCTSLGLLLYLMARREALPIRASPPPATSQTSLTGPPFSSLESKTRQITTARPSGPSAGDGLHRIDVALASPAPSAAPAPSSPETPDETEPPSANLERIRRLLVKYHSMFGENPVGNNEEITRALQGENSREAHFLEGADAPQNNQGELVDAWGTPLFFHQLSAKEMEIRSAGPDKVMWTSDDQVTR